MFGASKEIQEMEILHSDITKSLNETPRIKEIKKILLIDSEITSVLATALEREGHHVVHCECVQDAWNFVYPHRPHLIILSLRTADRTALADLRECRALARGVPIVLAASPDTRPALLNALPRGGVTVVPHSRTLELARAILHNPQRSMASY
jgi:DNA-binding NtrC family response regulator